MGEFTQNLLKLTEFPFSYSFIGLLALIFGNGINLQDLSFINIGPLLILMGFVATTLSICDPVGAFLRRIILCTSSPPSSLSKQEPNPKLLMDLRIFGKRIGEQFIIPYIVSTKFTPEDLGSRFTREQFDSWSLDLKDWKHGIVNEYAESSKELKAIRILDIQDRWYLFRGLQRKAVKTKWITAEIDRITALIYFMIVISVFIVAILLLPNLLQKFSQVFQDTELVRLAIVIFSILALAAVSYMIVLRKRSLMNNARAVFNYLTLHEAAKLEIEKFKSRFQDIERYLNDNDWILADYWITRIEVEYTEVFLSTAK